ALDENVQRSIIQRLGRVVGGLAVVGICAAPKQEARQLGVLRDAGRAVNGAFELGRVVVGGMKTGVRACTRVKQGDGRAQETLGARGVEAQVARETEVRQRVPSVRPTGGGCGAR